ncbi:MAG: RNA polymerase sporulation sigma factor, SigF/SigG family [Clostridiaceae bacterium]|nr:RNA polymerase sporulation sigma factor, SigF/SigG family [Clostridiaceae bacterium]
MNDKTSESKSLDNRTLNLILKAQKGDQEAQNTLVQENIGLVWSLVKRFKSRDAETEDIFQVGCIGLIKAIKKFDPQFEVKFSTYAVPMIVGEIKRFFRDDGAIKVSRALKELGQKANSIREQIEKTTGRTPTIHELAEKLNVEPEELVQAIEAGYQPESLYKTIGESENPMYLIDRLKIEDEDSKELAILERLSLTKALQNLDARSKQIIFLRYFKEETQQMVAEKMGISQVQVSRLEKKIMEELRSRFL